MRAAVETEQRMTFRERYDKLLTFKHPDVEEIVDMQVHRPAAAAFAATIYYLPITPNQVTYASLAVGWTGSVFLYDAAFTHYLGSWGYLLAGLFYFASVILDCADGQLARAKGGGTRMGRIVDGLVDAFVVVALYVVLTFDIANRWGAAWGLLAGLAGFNAWAQIVVYDKVKAIYMSRTAPSDADGTESLEEVGAAYEEIKKSGSLGEKIGYFIYYKVLLQVQEKFAPGSAEIDPEKLTPEAIVSFRSTFRDTMRVTTFLGLGTHMMLIYTAIVLATWWPPVLLGMQFAFITTFNLALGAALSGSRKMSRA